MEVQVVSIVKRMFLDAKKRFLLFKNKKSTDKIDAFDGMLK
ncbi:hypothetical protein QWZ06_11940 [Chryseobacterium tructae]|uniref:Uncharacterized protein n=1 Tax=Chryseobacterium tructae TaxID=1037380 RepID=A0ABV7XW54_9FLAO|nr:hypothetical protein [Chryseobacterium tructae]MDN3692941.1 hypothetical protein [Chryseobacterium tructae]